MIYLNHQTSRAIDLDDCRGLCTGCIQSSQQLGIGQSCHVCPIYRDDLISDLEATSGARSSRVELGNYSTRWLLLGQLKAKFASRALLNLHAEGLQTKLDVFKVRCRENYIGARRK